MTIAMTAPGTVIYPGKEGTLSTGSKFSMGAPSAVAPRPILTDATKRAPVPSHMGPSIISSDTRITGSIVSRGYLVINGEIDGDVCAQALTIGETGAVTGEVSAESVEVHGTIEGHVCGNNVKLGTGAKGRVDVSYAVLVIDGGAIVEGAFKHAPDLPVEQAGKRPGATTH